MPPVTAPPDDAEALYYAAEQIIGSHPHAATSTLAKLLARCRALEADLKAVRLVGNIDRLCRAEAEAENAALRADSGRLMWVLRECEIASRYRLIQTIEDIDAATQAAKC